MLLETARLFIRGWEDGDGLETDEMVIELGKRATPALCRGEHLCQRWQVHGQGEILRRLVRFGILDRSLGKVARRVGTRTASDHKIMHFHRQRGT